MSANNKSITLPSGEVVFGEENICPDGHFIWNEALNGLTRVPPNITVEGRIYKTAFELEKVRRILGGEPLIITSWYRDRAANDKIPNSAPNSRHLFGDGVDFKCSHISPRQIYRALDSWHQKGGLAVYQYHVHIDWRGFRSRW